MKNYSDDTENAKDAKQGWSNFQLSNGKFPKNILIIFRVHMTNNIRRQDPRLGNDLIIDANVEKLSNKHLRDGQLIKCTIHKGNLLIFHVQCTLWK